MRNFEQSRYLDFLAAELPDVRNTALNSTLVLDLFAGCGGLALGFEAAGFATVGFEMDPDACATYNANLRGRCQQTFLRPGAELVADRTVDLIIGGPPCQPFSVIGSQHGRKDSRDGFPAFISAMSRYQPKLAIFENVRGMLYRNRAYFDAICAQMRELDYAVSWRLMNAVDYGVPQNRERVVVVAHRKEWTFPAPIRSSVSFTVGDAFEDLASPPESEARFLTASMDRYVATYEAKSKCVNPRDLKIDRSSRTVTCRNLAAATADMLRVTTPDGRRRMLTEREGARLQSFPDWFQFTGPTPKRFEQIGNAVAPLFAKALAKAALQSLANADLNTAGIQRLNELNEQIQLYA